MKRAFLVAIAVVVSTSAFANINGPIRVGNKCWATVDQRGFGFWDECAGRKADRNYDAPKTTVPNDIANMAGGGGGGGGGR